MYKTQFKKGPVKYSVFKYKEMVDKECTGDSANEATCTAARGLLNNALGA